MILSTGVTMTPDCATRLLSRWLACPVHCTHLAPLHGGMVNSLWRVSFDHSPDVAVFKLSSEPGAFVHETAALLHLAEHTAMPVPAVYYQDHSREVVGFDVLIMEHIRGCPLGQARMSPQERDAFERDFARQVADLHAHTAAAFGSLDGSVRTARWSDIIVERLGEMRGEMVSRVESSTLARIDTALSFAPAAFADQGPATLVHGDLWDGNIMVECVDGRWVVSGLVDPGSEYADPEIELAELLVFQSVGTAFLDEYSRHHAIRAGFEYRKLFYWLRMWMVHVWLFGDQQYHRELDTTLTALLARPECARPVGGGPR